MGVGALLGIAIVAILVLLVLVIKFEFSAFVSLLLVAMGTAIVAGIPIEEVVPTMIAGMGKTLGSVAIIVGLGSMLGRIIEVSGGAEILAKKFTGMLGEKRVIAGVVIAAFILGIPVFFDVAFIILAPIVFAFAKVAKIHPVKIGLPVGGVLLTVHVAVPPHPGPVAAAATTGADVGLMTGLALIICIPVAIVGYFASKMFKVDKIQLLDSPATEAIEGDAAEAQAELLGGDGEEGAASRVAAKLKKPSAGMIVAMIVIPIALIMIGNTAATMLEEGDPIRNVASFFGQPTTALLIGVILAYAIIGGRMGWNKTERTSVLDSALPMVAVIIFVTGAGGVFGNVLVETGIGAALAEYLDSIGLPIIVAGFLIALALRAAQGSATVAILTAAGLAQPALEAANYTNLQTTLVTIAIAFGGLGLSHINDSGFWILTRYLGLSVGDGLRTWTVLTTILGLTGFAVTAGVFALVS